jgi:hypothetical protein
MGLIRALPLKDFRTTALAVSEATTGYQFGGLSTQEQVFAGLHLTCGGGTLTAMVVQSATASGFGSPAARITFTLTTAESYGLWGTPAGAFSSEHSWWRANYTVSGAGAKGMVYMGIRRAVLP